MKRLNHILMSLTLLVAALGCNKTEEAYINLSVDSIELSSDANDITFSAESNQEWTMTVSDHWFKITPKRGNGETEIRLVAERNQTGMDRTSVLEFTCGSAVKRLEVTQPAHLVNMNVECPATVAVKKGESFTVKLTTTADDWVYTMKNDEWM